MKFRETGCAGVRLCLYDFDAGQKKEKRGEKEEKEEN